MYSIQRNARILMMILIPVLVLNIGASMLASHTASRESLERADEVMEMYLDSLENNFDAVKQFITWSVLHENTLLSMQSTQNEYEWNKYREDFSKRVTIFQSISSNAFQYYLYIANNDFFVNCSPLMVSYPQYKKIREYYQERILRGTRSSFQWNVLELEDSTFLYYMITYGPCTLLCQINIEDLVAPLLSMNLGKQGYIWLRVDRQDYYIREKEIFRENPGREPDFFLLDYEAEKNSLPIQLHVYMSRFSISQTIILVQLVVVAAAVVIIGLLCVVLLYMNRRVIRPIREFSQNLSMINEESDILNLQSSNIIELEQANEQFKNLMREIKKLKIHIYEKELEKKEIELDFMRLQIRPHFYLNCLTTINSMVQTQNYKEAEEMSLATAKYLRYLLQNHGNYVSLEEEIRHIEYYLSISKLRYGDVFSYECQVEGDISGAEIPSLVLQTFVENAVKHAVSPEEAILIRLGVEEFWEEGMEWLKIEVMNTGSGFPEEVLKKLMHGQSLIQPDGTHVGITNVMQRLKLLYENNYSIQFENIPEGGALVKLVLPKIPPKSNRG